MNIKSKPVFAMTDDGKFIITCECQKISIWSIIRHWFRPIEYVEMILDLDEAFDMNNALTAFLYDNNYFD